MPRLMRGSGSFWRIALSFALVAVIVSVAGTGDVRAQLMSVDPVLFLAACALFLVGQWLNAQRWRSLLLVAAQQVPATSYLFCLVMIGMFFSTMLPSTVGGDIARAEMLRERVGGRAHAYFSVIAGRVIALLALVATGLMGLLLGFSVTGSSRWLLLATVVASAAALVFALIAWARYMPHFGQVIQRIAPAKIERFVLNARPIAATYAQHRQVVARVFVCAILANLVGNVCAVWVLALALGVDVPFYVHLIAVPLALLSALAPISINGLGVREGAFAFLYMQAGVPMASGVSVSVSYSAMLMILGLGGGSILLLPARLWPGARPRLGGPPPVE